MLARSVASGASDQLRLSPVWRFAPPPIYHFGYFLFVAHVNLQINPTRIKKAVITSTALTNWSKVIQATVAALDLVVAGVVGGSLAALA